MSDVGGSDGAQATGTDEHCAQPDINEQTSNSGDEFNEQVANSANSSTEQDISESRHPTIEGETGEDNPAAKTYSKER